VPAEAVSIDVYVQGARVGATYEVEACDDGFGKFACRKIFHLDVDVKCSCPMEKV
jgi:hypothetical protein